MDKRRTFGLCLVFGFALLAGCGGEQAPGPSSPMPEPLTIKLEAPGGLTLEATAYPAALPDAPGIILLHRHAADRNIWAGVLPELRKAGYALLAFDLREGGEAAQGGWVAVAQDIALAKAALIEHGADAGRIALMGEGLGANLALLYAVRDADIAALVLLSPGLEYRGLESTGLVGRLQKRPLLLLAAEQDAYAASSARALHAESPGFVELRNYPGSAHGVHILTASQTAFQETLVWLDKHFAHARTQTD